MLKTDDLISRKWLMECVNEGWIKFDTEKDKNTYAHLVRDIAPSAQETHEERTETHACDLISRQAAIDALIKWYGYEPSDIGAFENIIDKMPSAQLEPCEDAVSRKAVYDAMVEKGQRSRRYKLGEIWELNGTEIREALDTVPSVTPKRKTGKWIADNHDFWVCSNCKFPSEAHGANILYKFCPNCGADMRGADYE